MRPAKLVAVVLFGAMVAQHSADANETKRNWREEKCFRFERDWREALRRFGEDGLSVECRRGVEAFIRSQCERQAKICPRAARERELVDILAIRVVNEGMSTTFLPFDCPN